MTTMKRLAAALVAVFALSACAVTGQPAHPGTAATYGGATITIEQVAAWGIAQTDMSYTYDPGAVLTLLLLRPALEAEAQKESIVLGDDQITLEARAWMASKGANVVDPTPDMMDLVRTVHLLYAVVSTQDGATAVLAEIQAIEEGAEVNPMYGDFSATRFVDAVSTQVQAQQDSGTSLGDIESIIFRDVSGFDLTAQRSWMVDEGASQTASPEATPTPAA